MKKTTLFLLFFSFLALQAQNRHLLSKAQERAMLNRVKPVEHHYDHLRSPNVNTLLSENFDTGIPATWTVVDNTGNGSWTAKSDYNGNTLDGTPFVMTDSDAAGSGNVIDTELKSPVVDISAATFVYLSFDHFFKTYSGNDVADVDVYDGTQWVNVYTTSSNIGGWGNPAHQVIDVSAYKNANFQVRFHHYNADYEWYWALDNVSLFEPDADDLAITNVFPGTFQEGQDFKVQAAVYNNGSNTQNNFDVLIEILDSSNNQVFSETINVTGANLSAGNEYYVTSSTFANLTAGAYTVQATVTLAGDANTANDMGSAPLQVVDYHSTYQNDKVYSYIAYDADNSGDADNLIDFDLPSAAINNLGVLTTNDFLSAGDFIDNILVGVEFGTNVIYFIDGNGNAYKYGAIKNINDNVTGIAFGSNGVYVSTATDLYQIDPLLNAQPIGPMGNAGGVMVGLAADNNGNLFGVDLGDDKLYSIDSTLGTATEIGPLGVDISYAQDIGADPTTGNLYGTLFVDLGSNNYTSGLYSIDKTTGAATLIGSPQQDEYSICAIQGTTLSISDNKIEGLKIYPNPTNNMIMLKAKDNILHVSVVNIAGQTLFSFDNNEPQIKIDLSDLPAGNYILKIITDKVVGTQQVIKR